VGKCFGLHQVNEAIEYYKNNMTAGKVYLKPSIQELAAPPQIAAPPQMAVPPN
jgi:hypothetical protein